MARYHVGKNGSPSICKAAPGKCPLGGQHYDSMAEATAAAEGLAAPKSKRVQQSKSAGATSVWSRMSANQKITSLANGATRDVLPRDYAYRASSDGHTAHVEVIDCDPEHDHDYSRWSNDRYEFLADIDDEAEEIAARNSMWQQGYADGRADEDDGKYHSKYHGLRFRSNSFDTAHKILNNYPLGDEEPSYEDADEIAKTVNDQVRSSIREPEKLKSAMNNVEKRFKSYAAQRGLNPDDLDFSYDYHPIDTVDRYDVLDAWNHGHDQTRG